MLQEANPPSLDGDKFLLALHERDTEPYHVRRTREQEEERQHLNRRMERMQAAREAGV